MFRCSSENLWNTPNDETRIIFFFFKTIVESIS